MKTVKVKIALAVDSDGKWNASGWSNPDGTPNTTNSMDIAVDGVAEGESRYWIELEVPVPEVKIIKGATISGGQK